MPGVDKRVVPYLLFATAGLITLSIIYGMISEREAHFGLLLIPLGMAALGYLILKSSTTLLDEVWLDGETVILRRNHQEARIPLVDIVDMDLDRYMSLTLREPCVYGRIIHFLPPRVFLKFGTHPLVLELNALIDQARRNLHTKNQTQSHPLPGTNLPTKPENP